MKLHNLSQRSIYQKSKSVKMKGDSMKKQIFPPRISTTTFL